DIPAQRMPGEAMHEQHRWRIRARPVEIVQAQPVDHREMVPHRYCHGWYLLQLARADLAAQFDAATRLFGLEPPFARGPGRPGRLSELDGFQERCEPVRKARGHVGAVVELTASRMRD